MRGIRLCVALLLLATLGYTTTPARSAADTAAPPATALQSAPDVRSFRHTAVHPASGTGSVIPGQVFTNGGPVQTAPVVYVVYWGWTSDPYGVQAYLNDFLATVGGTAWLSPVTQYSGAGNPANLYAGSWSDPSAAPAQPTDAQVQSEALAAVQHFGLGTSVNIQIVVATPTGQSSSGFGVSYCAYHGAIAAYPNVTYTNLPYMPDAGTTCGANFVNGPLDGVSIIEGHELAESITDPLGNAWVDAWIPDNEIADKCAWTDLANITTSAGNFAVQPLWSQAANGCVLPTGPIAPPAPTNLSDAGDHVACPQDLLEWPSSPGATSYQVWGRETRPTLATNFVRTGSPTTNHFTVGVSRNWAYNFAVTACNANGWCSGWTNTDLITGGICE